MMEDNAAGRDFLSRLPLEITLEDFNNTTEKIFYPTPALDLADVTRGCAPGPGDITIYALEKRGYLLQELVLQQ